MDRPVRVPVREEREGQSPEVHHLCGEKAGSRGPAEPDPDFDQEDGQASALFEENQMIHQHMGNIEEA